MVVERAADEVVREHGRIRAISRNTYDNEEFPGGRDRNLGNPAALLHEPETDSPVVDAAACEEQAPLFPEDRFHLREIEERTSTAHAPGALDDPLGAAHGQRRRPLL